MTEETIQNVLGGGATGLLTLLGLYHKFYIVPKLEATLRDLKNIHTAVKHERDERKKLNPRFTQLQNELHAEKAVFVDFMNWHEKFKNDTEAKLTRVEEREHHHYLEVRDMQNEDKLLKKDIEHLNEKLGGIENGMVALKDEFKTMNSNFEDLKNLLIKTLGKNL